MLPFFAKWRHLLPFDDIYNSHNFLFYFNLPCECECSKSDVGNVLVVGIKLAISVFQVDITFGEFKKNVRYVMNKQNHEAHFVISFKSKQYTNEVS